jgi:hypothetical protein
VDAGLHVDEDVLAPQQLDDVGARHELLPALDEEDEHVHRLPLETDDAAMPAQLVGGDVELEVAEPVRFTCSGRGHGGAALSTVS